jgi:hypothetical protein
MLLCIYILYMCMKKLKICCFILAIINTAIHCRENKTFKDFFLDSQFKSLPIHMGGIIALQLFNKKGKRIDPKYALFAHAATTIAACAYSLYKWLSLRNIRQKILDEKELLLETIIPEDNKNIFDNLEEKKKDIGKYVNNETLNLFFNKLINTKNSESTKQRNSIKLEKEAEPLKNIYSTSKSFDVLIKKVVLEPFYKWFNSDNYAKDLHQYAFFVSLFCLAKTSYLLTFRDFYKKRAEDNQQKNEKIEDQFEKKEIEANIKKKIEKEECFKQSDFIKQVMKNKNCFSLDDKKKLLFFFENYSVLNKLCKDLLQVDGLYFRLIYNNFVQQKLNKINDLNKLGSKEIYDLDMDVFCYNTNIDTNNFYSLLEYEFYFENEEEIIEPNPINKKEQKTTINGLGLDLKNPDRDNNMEKLLNDKIKINPSKSEKNNLFNVRIFLSKYNLTNKKVFAIVFHPDKINAEKKGLKEKVLYVSQFSGKLFDKNENLI